MDFWKKQHPQDFKKPYIDDLLKEFALIKSITTNNLEVKILVGQAYKSDTVIEFPGFKLPTIDELISP